MIISLNFIVVDTGWTIFCDTLYLFRLVKLEQLYLMIIALILCIISLIKPKSDNRLSSIYAVCTSKCFCNNSKTMFKIYKLVLT